MILVRLHCPRCNRTVAQVERAPDTWDGVLRFDSCKCVRPRSERAQAVYAGRSWEEWEFVREVRWADLRVHVDDARKYGRTIDVMLVVT